MSSASAQAKQKRGYALGKLTRVRRRAQLMINADGSKTELLGILSELDEAFSNLQLINDQYIDTLENTEAVKEAQSYIMEAETQFQEIISLIELQLRERKEEREMMAAVSQCSSSRTQMSESKRTELVLKMKELHIEQLKRRHEREKKEEELKRANELENARDSKKAAELEAKLTLAAESQFNWERRNDFVGEESVGEAEELNGPQETVRSLSASRLSSPACTSYKAYNITPAVAEVACPGNGSAGVDSGFLGNLPRLELTKFSGEPGEWPRWFALFQTLVDNQASLSETEKMAHLQGSVIGPAQKTIAGMFYDGRLYHAALAALKDRYGRQEDIVHSNMSAVFSCPPPTYLDPESMDRFHAAVHSAVSVLKNLGYEGDLLSTENLRNVVKKLPPELKRGWGQYVLDMDPVRPSLIHLDDWLRRQVRVAMNYASVLPEEMRSGRAPRSQVAKPRQEFVRRTAFSTEVENYGDGCKLCGGQHRLESCPPFLEKDVNERVEFVMTSGKCFYCLKGGHKARNCKIAKQCGIGNCRMRHHQLLHGSRRVGRFPPTEASPVDQDGASSNARTRIIAAASKEDLDTTLLQVVRVMILGKQGRSRTVNALLDPGAQTSLCCEEVLRHLKISGEERKLQLLTVRGCGAAQHSQRVTLTLLPTNELCPKPILVPEVFSVPELHVKVPCLERYMQNWSHIQGLDITGYDGQKVELLLGANIIEAVLQQEVRVGKPGEPVAVKTAFGWALAGTLQEFVPERVKQVMFVHRTASAGVPDFLQEWWSTESFGTKHESQFPTSAEDRRAMKIFEETTRQVENRYEVGLLWKTDDVKMPDNYEAALRRLTATEKSISKDPEKASVYEDVLMGYVTKGHARKLTREEARTRTSKTWFLPHHGVSNPNKKKLRVVFDAAAPFQGTSLNDHLLTGPDLLQSLVGILLRFREERVAIMADITEMFHQVGVRPEDQPALTFLWRNCDPLGRLTIIG